MLFDVRHYELQSAPHTCFPWQVLGPSLRIAERLSYAASYAPDILSTKSIRPYLRNGLRLFDYHHHLMTTTGCAYDPLGEPEDVLLLVIDFLRANRCTASEKGGVWYIDAPAAERHDVLLVILGLFALFEGLRAEGVYRHRHPLKMAGDGARVVKRLNDGSEVMVRPGRTLIRVRGLAGSVGRVAEPDLVERMIAALVAAGVPASILMMMRTMSIALARLSEQCLLSMLDYWNASEFGDEVDTVNKGSRLVRTKRQIWDGDHTVSIHGFIDAERALLDPDGRTLRDFRLLAAKEDWAALAAAPLFPTAAYRLRPEAGFYTPGGVADVHLRPAFDAAGLLGVGSHHMRHGGVTRFLRWLKSLGLTHAEEMEWKAWFGAYMGWASWELMIEHYSQPFREEDRRERAHQWLRGAAPILTAIRAGMVDAASMPSRPAIAAPAAADFSVRPTDAGLSSLVGPIGDWRNPAPIPRAVEDLAA